MAFQAVDHKVTGLEGQGALHVRKLYEVSYTRSSSHKLSSDENT